MRQEDDQVACYFLDDGIYEKIAKSNLRELDERFMQLPFQAFNVQLDGLEGKSDCLFRKFFDEKMRSNDDALCLIARPTSYEPITVRLFDTSGSNDLDLNLELLGSMSDLKDLPGTLESVAASELPAKLKEEDGHRVVVSMAINPNSFVVSSASLYKEEFEKMELELEQVYASDENKCDFTIEMVYPGLYVSARDKRWYRARIEEQIGKEPRFTAYLIDVGRITVVELPDIQPLYSRFFKLPMRVSRASLNGLVPTGDRFSIDATFFFKRLVDGQEQFTAHDVDLVTVDSETYVMLDLKHDGKSISEELVSAGMAKYIS